MASSSQFQLIPLSESQLDFPGCPYSVSVLKVGYYQPQQDGTFKADGSITLITGHNNNNILVDTGGPWDRDFLLKALKDRGLEPGDIHLVVGTHGHSDHVGNLSLFHSSVMIVGHDISHGDIYTPSTLAQGCPHIVDEHVCVLPTPGHTGQDVSVQVRGTSAGTLLVAGDLFDSCCDEDTWRHLSANTAVQEAVIPAIHIHLTSSGKCCANRCGMFLSIGFAAVGVAGAVYSLSVAALGLSNGPLCYWSNLQNPIPKWGVPFANSSASYLEDKEMWKWCLIPKNVVEFNVGLFSTLLVAASLQFVLCLIQMINGLFGCICGTCGGKE
ncbi:metallo-beta-lactamase domain-containing protein 1 isoform X1 [Nerophis lumbriciformis]|uniref:metallo-beta-lactamase domain-containing protein 1 isoform X1 n=1 Tax=Nerophis lumbriciformis TaxID=546530 RepID=UPI002AE03E6B|nr:metallo-beta-lactamase domain-containing protein 1-like isoform X1 [Nerophis lumbriciformis]